MKKLYFVALASLFFLASCGGGRPVIVEPQMGARIQVGNQNQGAFLTVRVQDDNPDVQISFVIPQSAQQSIFCQPGLGFAQCFSQNGLFQETTIGIIAQNGDERDVVVVTLVP